NRREADLTRTETDRMRGRDLEQWAGQLDMREKQVADRESAIAEEAELSETARTRVDKREKRLSQTEANLRERVREIDEREDDLHRREARYETDYDIRLDKLEAREQALAELEEKLGTKENQLAAYVAQAQGALQRRESEWWNKQLGRDEEDVDTDAA